MLRIEQINPCLPEPDLRLAAQQCAHVMQWVQRDVYARDLGLARIDPDPMPDPTNNVADVEWRMRRIRTSGSVEEAGLEFIRAVQVDAEGKPLAAFDAMLGFLVLRKTNGLCTSPRGHRATEIVEFDVHESVRGQGVGRALLGFGMIGVHPKDRVVLDVARPNQQAQRLYRHYGFEFANKRPKRHGIFDVEHIGMRTTAADLQRRLSIA